MSRSLSRPSGPTAALLLAGALTLGGCASLGAGSGLGGAPGERLVTSAQIQQSNASNAWEAIRRTLHTIRLSEDERGNPSGMSHRGASSLLLSDVPSVFVDGVRLSDFRQLHQIPVAHMHSIRFLNGMEGTTRYGTNSGDGVILIRTKSGEPTSE